MARYMYVKYMDSKTGANVVKVITHYAGKPVYGIAKCSIKDTFSADSGKDLAKARCDYKIAVKRQADSRLRVLETRKQIQELYEKLAKYENHYDEDTKEVNITFNTVLSIETMLNRQ